MATPTSPSRPAVHAAPPLPPPRGPLTSELFGRLRRPPHDLGDVPAPDGDVLSDDDLQLALYACYELHYRSFRDVDDRWEWHPGLLRWRAALEAGFEAGLAGVVAESTGRPGPPASAEEDLWRLISEADGPSLSKYVAGAATLADVRELAVHRAPYQLKEADPHTWGIPRLTGGPKAAMVEIQADEYGGGRAEAMHSSLFAVTMQELGLDPAYGAYLDLVPGVTLATVNVISLFGLHRRLRGALVGHLAVFEMSSVGPMARYSSGLARLGTTEPGRRFYEVHVEADAHHQFVAARDLAGGLAAAEPELVPDILFGARAVLALERRFTTHVLEAWASGRTSLRRPLDRQPAPPGPRCTAGR